MPPSTLLPPIQMTRAEFDAWAPYQEIPYELVEGRVEPKYLSDDGLFAEAGGRVSHQFVMANTTSAMHLRRPEGSVVLVDARVQCADATNQITDVALTCEILQEDAQNLHHPCLIFDVLSPSTQHKDWTARLFTYRMMPSVTEIWLIRMQPRHVDVWKRVSDGWHVVRVSGNGTIHSAALTSPVPLDELYEGLPL